MNIKQLIMKIYFNMHPTYHSTGGRVKWISADWKKVVIEIPLNWRTRNYVGTIFGGSMYSAVDPIYMIMLIQILGRDYIVWDKGATIQFIKPGKSRLKAEFILTDDVIRQIQEEAKYSHSIEKDFLVNLVDLRGMICAKIQKRIYIRLKKSESPEEGTRVHTNQVEV